MSNFCPAARARYSQSCSQAPSGRPDSNRKCTERVGQRTVGSCQWSTGCPVTPGCAGFRSTGAGQTSVDCDRSISLACGPTHCRTILYMDQGGPKRAAHAADQGACPEPPLSLWHGQQNARRPACSKDRAADVIAQKVAGDMVGRQPTGPSTWAPPLRGQGRFASQATALKAALDLGASAALGQVITGQAAGLPSRGRAVAPVTDAPLLMHTRACQCRIDLKAVARPFPSPRYVG
jgi:hypothetical protein